MLNRIINKISGDYNAKQLKKREPLIHEINSLYLERDNLSDEAIQAKTQIFKERIAAWEELDTLLPEAFATVKQAAKRLCGTAIKVKWDDLTWNMIHYDVQLLWWIVLHKSWIAEMRTGEGKTLVATLPCYLNALSGKWVHVVTVNDYLASRDAEWMAYLYNWLWLTVWSVTKSVALDKRREQYEKDITYVENSELWFDYLRDNLVTSMDERKMMWRPLHYALIDEVDSILIDEARTPMIISYPSQEPTEKYAYYAKLITLLTPSKNKKKVKKWFLQELLKDIKEEEQEKEDNGDYYIDEKTKSVSLSSWGIEKLEWLLKVENLYKDLWYQEIHHIENALKAQACFHRDKEYLVRDGQILLVDDHTWRVMPGRRFSQGLHQALEAKEQVKVQRESKTMASITYQHFFKQYEKLAWMTGTAVTEAEEFEKIYDLEVLTIPTNKPILRVDKSDQVYFNQQAKWKAVVEYITFYHKIGLPILIGTSSIQTSELVSWFLDKMTLSHYVLNAKFHESEANIVKNAGKKGSIVVATNMAWRGTDIKLDEQLFPSLATKYAQWTMGQIRWWKAISIVVYSEQEFDLTVEALKTEIQMNNEDIRAAEKTKTTLHSCTLQIKFNTNKKTKEDAFAECILAPLESYTETVQKDFHYWLFILGTEKHDSRRIDNQLRGRAWRQGDPWVSQFFVAMDDEIMRKMWGNKIQTAARLLMSQKDLESMVFTQKQFTSSIARAQKQMEGRHFGIRKHLFDYDSVINKQRERIYAKRDTILQKEHTNDDTSENQEQIVVELSVVDEVKHFIDDVVDNLVETYTTYSPWNTTELAEELSQITTASFLDTELQQYPNTWALRTALKSQVHDLFTVKFENKDNKEQETIAKRIYLYVLDKYWQEHIDDMQYLREKVSLYGYAQLDPLVIYKKEAYEKFQRLLRVLKTETVANVFRANIDGPQTWSQENTAQKTNMVDMLKRVTKELQGKQTTPTKTQDNRKHIALWDGQEAAIVSQDDDIEVLEVLDEEDTTSHVDMSKVKKKLRPNDKVNVQYPDGRIEYGVKYKKVKDALEAGELSLYL